MAGVHPVHLSREFRKHYRMTIGDYIRKRRIEHASELLSNSGTVDGRDRQHLRVFRSKPLLRALQEALRNDARQVSGFVGVRAWMTVQPPSIDPGRL